MGDWWIYPIVGVGIVFVTWILGAGPEEGHGRGRVAVSADVDRRGERRGERQTIPDRSLRRG